MNVDEVIKTSLGCEFKYGFVYCFFLFESGMRDYFCNFQGVNIGWVCHWHSIVYNWDYGHINLELFCILVIDVVWVFCMSLNMLNW